MLVFQIPIWRTGASHQQDDNGSQQYTTMISQRRSKERQKRQAELQQQERLLKLQKREPGVLIADFASEIVEIESLNTSEAEQVQEQTVDLQPDEQLTHDCSTQRLLIIYIGLSRLPLLRTVDALMPLLKQKSLTTCLPIHRRASLSSRISESVILHRPANIQSARSHFYSCFTFCQTPNRVPLYISRDDNGSRQIKTKCSTPRLGL